MSRSTKINKKSKYSLLESMSHLVMIIIKMESSVKKTLKRFNSLKVILTYNFLQVFNM